MGTNQKAGKSLSRAKNLLICIIKHHKRNREFTFNNHLTYTVHPILLLEYLPCGDLLGFLRKSRGVVDKYYRGEGEEAKLKTYDLVSFSNQIATGMVFLASRGVSDSRTNQIHLTVVQIAKYIGTSDLIKYNAALLLQASAQ